MITTIITVNSYSQTYEFINEVLEFTNKDTLYLKDKFFNLDENFINGFNEKNVKDWWYPLPNSKTPSIKPFLDNFNINHLKADLLNNRCDTIIDFKRLKPFLYKSSINDEKVHRKRTYITISKPIFNCSKNWAVMIFTAYRPYANAGGGGYMHIYKKRKGKWILYKRLE
ncbi:MAG: hypothetical protein IIC67_00335, partial [Thaumarchaeota archaeon]|nr:hypothetical protein [Nitrososphaerota archaeon]